MKIKYEHKAPMRKCYLGILFMLAITILSPSTSFSQCAPTIYGSSNSRCNPGEIIFTAVTQNSQYAGVQHKWYDSPSGGTLLYTYNTTNFSGTYHSSRTETISSDKSYWVSSYYNGCESSRNEVKGIIDASQNPTISPSTTPLDVCSNLNFSLTSSAAASYDWRYSTTTTMGTTTISTAQAIYPTNDGYYWVRTPAGACGTVTSAYIPVTFREPLTPSVSINGGGSIYCPGVVVTLTAVPTGYSALPSYQWTIGSNNYSGSSVSYTVDQNTSVSLEMTSNDNCVTSSTANASTILDMHPYPTQGELQGVGAYCEPFSGASMVVYNSQSGYYYHLFRGSNLAETVVGTGGVVNFSVQTLEDIYTLQGSNANCTSDKIALPGSVTVTSIPPTTVSIQTGGINTTSVCESTGITLTAQASRSIQQVIWRNVDTGAVMNSQVSPSAFQFVPPTTIGLVNYRAEMSVDSGCGNYITKNVDIPVTHVTATNVQVSISGGGGIYCPGEVIHLTAAPQNSTNNSFVWKYGTQTISTQNYADVTVDQTKTITLTMTSNDFCVNQPQLQTTTLQMKPVPTGQLVGADQICLDDPDGNPGIDLKAYNATQGYDYYLFRDGFLVETKTNVDVSQTGGILSFLTVNDPGNYMLKAAIPGCSGSIVILTNNHLITQEALTTVGISASGPTLNLCLSSNISLSVNASREIYGVQWMMDGVDVSYFLDDTTFDPTQIGTAAYGPHNYSALITVNNGCGAQVNKVTTTIVVEIDGASIASPTTIGDNGCLSDAIHLEVQNFSYTVRWFQSQTDANQNVNYFHEGPILDTLFQNGGLYTFYVIDFNSAGPCTSQPVSISANVLAPLPPSSKIDGKAFEGQPMTLSVSGGGPGYNWYDASSGGNLITTGSSYSITPVESTTYYVYSVDQTCESTNYITVDATVYPALLITSSSGDIYLPIGGTVELLVGTYDSYDWKYRGQTVGTTSVYTASNTGIYTVNVTVGTESASADFTLYNAWEDQDQQINYIVTSTLKKPVSDDFEIGGLSIFDRDIQINYFDGLGRDLQNVGVQASSSMTDIIQPIEYDNFGRQSKQFLAYSANNSNGKYDVNAISGLNNQSGFYNNPPQYVISDPFPFSQIIYDDSPLNRVIEQGAPGSDWQPIQGNPGGGNTILYSYENNVSTDLVRQWGLVNGLPSYSSDYSTRELYKNVIRDEEKHVVEEFTNKKGQTILKRVQVDEGGTTWADTYYIYDDFDNLRYVLPPEASNRYDTEYGANPQAFLAKWAFQYQYDNMNRMVIKQVPGAEAVYMVYDGRDRLVLTQDGNQRDSTTTTGKEWSFMKYDHLNRPVLTGIYEHPTAIDQATMQSLVDAHYTGVTNKYWYEAYGIAEPIFGYTNRSFPSVPDKTDYLTITYYDNYIFLDYLVEFGNSYLYNQPTTTCINLNGVDYCYEAQASTQIKGQITGTKIRNLNNSQSWINSVMYYDAKYRLIQTISNNQIGGLDRSSNLYDFVGELLVNYLAHATTDGVDIKIKTRFEYDHADRLIRGYHEIIDQGTSQGEVLLAENKFNELGELIEKNLHVENNIPLQSVDYRYNIRGWLQSINNSTLTIDGINVDSPSHLKDMFGMELIYNNPVSGIPNN